jgi:hypothetical protein
MDKYEEMAKKYLSKQITKDMPEFLFNPINLFAHAFHWYDAEREKETCNEAWIIEGKNIKLRKVKLPILDTGPCEECNDYQPTRRRCARIKWNPPDCHDFTRRIVEKEEK